MSLDIMCFKMASCDVIGYNGMSFDIMSTCCPSLAQCGLVRRGLGEGRYRMTGGGGTGLDPEAAEKV